MSPASKSWRKTNDLSARSVKLHIADVFQFIFIISWITMNHHESPLCCWVYSHCCWVPIRPHHGLKSEPVGKISPARSLNSRPVAPQIWQRPQHGAQRGFCCPDIATQSILVIPSGSRANSKTTMFFMGKSTISMAMASMAMLNYRRIYGYSKVHSPYCGQQFSRMFLLRSSCNILQRRLLISSQRCNSFLSPVSVSARD